MDRRPALCGVRSIRATLSRFRRAASGRDPLRRRGDRSCRDGPNLPRGAGFCTSQHQRKSQPLRLGGGGRRMPASAQRSTVGAFLFWQRSASYCPVADVETTARCLESFHAAAPTAPSPPRPPTWGEVAADLKIIYEQTLAGRLLAAPRPRDKSAGAVLRSPLAHICASFRPPTWSVSGNPSRSSARWPFRAPSNR